MTFRQRCKSDAISLQPLPVVLGTTGWTCSGAHPGNPEDAPPTVDMGTLNERVKPGGVTRNAGKYGHDVAVPIGPSIPSTMADTDPPGVTVTVGMTVDWF
jgi:hypothetical protein